jgi:2-(1,2-epoxy-1,2-dihydrophenyl)acetyl-CoA isomerase
MPYDTITLETVDDVATLTLNRPDRLNACSLEMADEMCSALSNLGAARALLIKGEGRAFCSGADLQEGPGGALSSGDAAQDALLKHFNPVMTKLMRLDLPVVTAVNGAAAGVGCSIALAGDFVIAGKSGYFLQAFVNIGLIPDGGSSWILQRLIGKSRATEMMMLGEKVYGEKAVEWNMIYKCVEDDALEDEARALAVRLAKMPTLALGIMRRNLDDAMQCDFQTALRREAEGQRLAGNSEDARIGTIAFLKKEKPKFIGK